MSQYAGKQTTAATPSPSAGPARAPAPGKSTLVEQVQHQAGGSAPDVHAKAEAGTAGPGGAMPFGDVIQRAFGGHDIGGIRAHTDGAAQRANAAMGSKAFARGNDVAFGGAPDLHTAAHEAAHVVQQRSGVQLKGGVGQAGDAYERHADAVADQVVAGNSAEGLLSQMAGGAPAVQHAVQFVEGAQPDAGDASVGPTPLARVQDAANANDLNRLVAIQVELVGKLQQQAANPPKDLRDGIAFARTWTMDRIAAIRDKYAPQVAAASATTAQGDDNAAAVEAIELQEDQECTPYLDALLKGDPQYRYLHFNLEVQDKVFAAVRLHSARRGLTGVGDPGHRAAAEKEARTLGNLATGSWCGVFAYAQAAKGGGMDPHWAEWMQGEGGIRSALNYAGMQKVWVWAFDHWESLRQYHQSRGSLRYYEVLGAGLPTRQVQPGDIALLDRDFGLDPDHIITVASYDGRYLYTIGGNQGTDQASDEKGVGRSGPFDLATQPTPNDVTQWETDAEGKPKKGHKPGVAKHERIHGIGRWSIVDYETHVYTTSDKMPTKPPADAELRKKQQ